MELLYILLNRQGKALAMKTGVRYALPELRQEVTDGYGFDSVVTDNLWFQENCGLEVFRKYIFFDAGHCVAVFESSDKSEPLHGFAWVGAEEIHPPEQRDFIKKALANRQNSLCTPWMRSACFESYLDWVDAVAEEHGLSISGKIEQTKNAYVSSLFRIPTNAGDLYLKIPSSVYLNHVEVECFLSREIFDTPRVLALSPDRTAILTCDMKGADIAADDVSAYSRIVKIWGEKQQALSVERCMQREEWKTLPDYTPQKLLSSLEGFIRMLKTLSAYDAQGVLNGDCLGRAEAKMDDMEGKLRQLCEYPLPNTLCHGDIRSGNIREVDGQYALYDWGMSFYSHPFYDICHLLHVTQRQISEADRNRILLSYLDPWKKYGATEDLLKTYELVNRLMNFLMTYSDGLWLIQILEACNYNIPKCSIDSWLFERRQYYFNKVFNRFINEE